MKTKVFAVCAVIFLSCSIVNAGINDGLVAYYPFNGNANDESGHGNNGTVYGATLTEDRFGNLNNAYIFHGNDQIYCGNDPSLQINSFTTSVWVNYKGTLPHPYAPTIINKASKGVDGYSLWLHGSRFATELSNPGTWNLNGLSIDKDIIKNIWYMLTVTYDHTKKIVSIYLNGEYTNSTIFQMATPVTKGLTIGNGYDTLGDWGTVGFDGIIDEVRIYNRTLSESEIQQLYQGQSTCSSEVIKFTAGTHAKAADVNANFDALNCQIQALKAIVCQDHPTASVCQ